MPKKAERVAKAVCACKTPGCVTYELDRVKKLDDAAISDKAKRKINASLEKMEPARTASQLARRLPTKKPSAARRRRSC
jgi:hypothetical protein